MLKSGPKVKAQFRSMRQDQRKVGLSVDGVHLSFGGVKALQDVSLDIGGKDILAIIGPNGAGKTCLLNCISGFYRPDKGKITFNEQDITRLAPHKIAELGVARTFQNIELYTGLTTLENMMAARHMFLKGSILTPAIYFPWVHKEEVEHRERVEEIIDFLELESVRKQVVGTLAYGTRKVVELGRALALEPRILLLDEPMAGMNLEEKEDMARFIIDIYEEMEIPIILIEHDMEVVMDLSNRIMVLDFGSQIAIGSPDEVKTNPRVIDAYIGQSD